MDEKLKLTLELWHDIDLIELNEEGLIQELEVFIRPANGLLALGEEMRRRLSEIRFA